jgi:hypothetical protein
MVLQHYLLHKGQKCKRLPDHLEAGRFFKIIFDVCYASKWQNKSKTKNYMINYVVLFQYAKFNQSYKLKKSIR